MSDDEEDEYNTITQAASSRGVKLLFSKSKVRQSPSKRNINLTINSGLCASDFLFQRQYPWLYRPHPAKTPPRTTCTLVSL
jgi:hypothetical protein